MNSRNKPGERLENDFLSGKPSAQIELPQIVQTVQKTPCVGKMSINRSAEAQAEALRFSTGSAHGCRKGYSDRSCHWLR